MNPLFGRLLLSLFCLTVGLFHLAKGISEMRSRQGSRLLGTLRILLSILLFTLPLAFWFFTRGL